MHNLLGRLWGVKRDVIFDKFWQPNTLFTDEVSSQKLYLATERAIDSIEKKKNSALATIALNILTHKMTKYASACTSFGYDRRSAQHEVFIYRGKIIGESFRDQKVVEFYKNQVKNSELL